MEQTTLYLTELDVTRLERIAARTGNPHLAEQLDALLERAAIVEPGAVPRDVVTMNSRLRCTLEGDPAPREWTLVYPDAADFEAGRVSVFSPVGQALLGARVNDTVSYRLPDGRAQTVTIQELSWQPEANGEFTV
ncbi:nucleoside diphosphate kinase regulator [Cupriavidus sp. AU9028]|uniref:nucleoside diphosphate kinase regulator n=1 Tax=Cupriavidus sp. AU9028 TaxID=2871157 RepID=UPI00351D904D